MISQCIAKIVSNKNLEKEEMLACMDMIMDGKASEAQMASFLTALRMKGETVDEIYAAAKVMRDKANCIHIDSKEAIDIVGTGGDGFGTFNISTATSFVVAGAGLTVAKHGNRAVSSKCGSADVLEGLGVVIDLPPEKVGKCIDEIGIGFLFAPQFHSAMRYVAPVRKELGMRTIFNMLGPLTNPVNASILLTGVYDEKLTEVFAHVLKDLNMKRTLVVHGEGGLDELVSSGSNKVSELRDNEVITYFILPEDLGIKRCSLNDIKGGTVDDNVTIIKNILKGEKGPKRDTVLLNAGAALYISGRTGSIKEGIEYANEILDSGKAYSKLQELIEFTKTISSEIA